VKTADVTSPAVGDAALGRRTAVVSPHLDDAVFSLGATMARASRLGSQVRIVTVFAGEPGLDTKAGWWDRRAGFSSAKHAYAARREEDRHACALIGAVPVWLPFSDGQYAPEPDPAVVRQAVLDAVGGCDSLVLPGFPLQNPEHAWVTTMLLTTPPKQRLGFYAEQPYAWRAGTSPRVAEPLQGLVRQPVTWHRVRADRAARRSKRRAAGAYRSQLQLFGLAPLWRMALHETRRGGEALAWIG
jgi:LmbE family N-acetylglucosaminyl deacetylase